MDKSLKSFVAPVAFVAVFIIAVVFAVNGGDVAKTTKMLVEGVVAFIQLFK